MKKKSVEFKKLKLPKGKLQSRKITRGGGRGTINLTPKEMEIVENFTFKEEEIGTKNPLFTKQQEGRKK